MAQENFKTLDASYVEALRTYVTEPVLTTPPSDTTQKHGNPGALLADLQARRRG